MLLSILFLFTTAITLWFIIDCKQRFILKICSIIMLGLFSCYVYKYIDTLKGLPIEKPILGKVLVATGFIREPSLDDPEGGIYLVLEEPDNIYKFYKLPYDRRTHENLTAALQASAESGSPIVGEMRTENKKQGRDIASNEFYLLPPSNLEK